MSNDFYIAFLTGWFILIIFWSTIIVFVHIRKPPNAKLTKKVFVVSFGIFLVILCIIIPACKAGGCDSWEEMEQFRVKFSWREKEVSREQR